MDKPLRVYQVRTVRTLNPLCIKTQDWDDAVRHYNRLKQNGTAVEFTEHTTRTLKTFNGADEQIYLDGGYHPLGFAGEAG